LSKYSTRFDNSPQVRDLKNLSTAHSTKETTTDSRVAFGEHPALEPDPEPQAQCSPAGYARNFSVPVEAEHPRRANGGFQILPVAVAKAVQRDEQKLVFILREG
jgi:hypothetical protein